MIKIFNTKNFTLSIDLKKSYEIKTVGLKGKIINDKTGSCLLIRGKSKTVELPAEIVKEKSVAAYIKSGHIVVSDVEEIKKKKGTK